MVKPIFLIGLIQFNLSLDLNKIDVQTNKSHGGKHLKVEVKKYKK
jgi:hypothetical protein